MFWLIIPAVMITALIVYCVALYVSKTRRDEGSVMRESKQTLYDRNENRKSPQAPPA